MSGKRANLGQITRENPDDEDESIDLVTKADASVMARRKIAVPRSRRAAAGQAKSNPFSAPAAPANPFASFSKPATGAPTTSTASNGNGAANNNDKLLQRRALNEKFVAKLNDLAKDNVYGDWSKTVQQYITFSNQIESGSISKPEETKPAPASTAFSFGASSDKSSFGAPAGDKSSFGAPAGDKPLFGAPSSDKPLFGAASSAGAPSFSSEKPFSFGAPKPAETKPAPSLFQFGKPATTASTTIDAPMASAQKSTATEADKVDVEKPAATTQSTTKDESSDESDDEVKVEGPKFTLAAPPTTKDSPFSFNKPTSETDKAKSGAGFKFESTGPVKSVFKFDAPAKEEPAKEEPAKPFSFGASTTTWTPDKGIKFGSADIASANASANTKPAFSFGSTTSSTTTNADKPAFSFGSTTSSTTNNAEKPAFSFGSTNNPAFSFGSSTSTTEKTDDKPKFTFGGADKSSTSNGLFGSAAGATKPFTFNAPSTGFSFGSNPETKQGEPKGAAEGDMGATDESAATTPAAAEHDLSEKGPGEEEEDVKYEQRAKLYELVNGEFKVQGLGTLRVLTHKQTKKSRALLRAEGSGRVILNVLLRSQIKYTTEGKGQVKLIDFKADGNPTTYMLRVKTQEDGEKLRDVLETEKKGN
ncbi:hypothetical protein TRVA0_016S01266 [Trichomonascus vanleenenianus]|uniref:nucleoporin NUP2 n=1 Tax=Trichomonascus vanleenenianus TaxID=2268995 RepID=UPI003ECB9F7A